MIKNPKINHLDMVNKKFNRLTILCFFKTREYPYYNCICECGNKKTIRASHVITGLTKSCGCLSKEVSKLMGQAMAKRTMLPNSLAAKKVLFNRYRTDIRGYEFSLTFERFVEITGSNCYYCDKEPSKLCKPKHSNSPGYKYNGVDRLNNNEGYIEGNVVAACFDCNTKKYTFSLEEFADWIKTVFLQLQKNGVLA